MVMSVYFVLKFFEWFKKFKEGREEIGDDQRPGRPSTLKILKKSVKLFDKNVT